VSVNIYVGNLPFSTTNDDLERLFAEHGTVSSARVITDRDSGASRGFGFVEMDDDGAAQTAISALDGQEVDGRPLRVNEARERR
jgi:RNA recognition motif-containing protein